MTAATAQPVASEPLELGFTDEQEQLRELVRSFLAANSSEEDVRALMQTEEGFDEKVWSQMAEELGLPGLLIPEQFGGAGLTAVEVGIVLEEMGRTLYCGPFLSTAVMAASALVESGDSAAQAELLPDIATGQTRMTLAFAEQGQPGFDPETLACDALDDGDGVLLNGVKDSVVDGATADSILVIARGRDGLGLFHVDGAATGLERTPVPTLDPTRKLARLHFSKTPARPIAADFAAIESTLERIVVAMACEQVGGAQHCLDMAVEYAQERIQFGRPIGSFQAIKHKCADLLIGVEAAKSAARYAAACAAHRPDERAVAASMAKAYCSDVYTRAAEENLQIHGGIGFTWEHSCHLYLKRARSSQLLFGDPLHHREHLASLVGI
ncbi:MAG: acyl-CoA/acyl-ACP dehydrogenase [bacterium]|nr:acyl-CoA/acyl-ACP dehydrogenase [bacterium]